MTNKPTMFACAGLACLAFVNLHSQQPNNQAQDVVRARRFELVNERGEVAAVLTSSGEKGKGVSLTLTGHDGHNAGIGVSSDGKPYLTLQGANGLPRATLSVDPIDDRDATLSLADGKGKSDIEITAYSGRYKFAMNSSDGRTVLYSPTDGPKIIVQRGRKSKTVQP